MSGLFEFLEANNYSTLNKILLEQRKIIHNLSSVLDNLPGSIYWKDLKGVYLGHNAFARSKMKEAGLPYDSIVGKTDYDLFTRDVADQYRKHDLEVIERGVELSREETVILGGGKSLIQLSSKRPLLDENCNIIGVIGNTVDITHIKQIEEELRVSKERAEKADQFKTEFMRNMEHDIRTPFNGIWVLASMLEAQEADPEKKEYLGDISNAAKELLDYCNEILRMTKMGYIQPNSIEKIFDLRMLIKNVIIMEKVAAKNKKIDLRWHYPETLPALMSGDEKSIQRILLNLVSNAIKFTEKGYVEVRVELLQRINKSNIAIRLIVEDTGAGVPLEKTTVLLEKQSKRTAFLEALRSERGLGLPVVKQLVEELGGEIEVFTEIGIGSKFIVNLHLKLASQEITGF